MTTARERAEWYRKEAKTCLELSGRMSLNADRARLVEMANHWAELARRAEEKADFEETWKSAPPEL